MNNRNAQAYIADYNQFVELITADGRVIRRVDWPDGIRYAVVERGIRDIEAWIKFEGLEGNWKGVDENTVRQWLDAAGEPN